MNEMKPATLIVDHFKKILHNNVRHPVVVPLLMIFWSTPVLTIDRLALNLALSVYPLFQSRLDSADLIFSEQQVRSLAITDPAHTLELKIK